MLRRDQINEPRGYVGPVPVGRAVSDFGLGAYGEGLDWFLAAIVDRGPNDEPDYTDSRYWVRQLTPAGPLTPEPASNDRPIYERLDVKLDANPLFVDFTDHAYHVTAVNLAEYSVIHASDDTHNLATDASLAVMCRLIRARNQVQRWAFTHGGAGDGGAMIDVVIRDASEPYPSRNLTVQKVEYDVEANPIALKTVGSTFPAVSKPGLFARDYNIPGMVWQTALDPDRTRFFQANKRGPLWIVRYELDFAIRALPAGVRHTDGNPIPGPR